MARSFGLIGATVALVLCGCASGDQSAPGPQKTGGDPGQQAAAARPPNIIILFADDLGYGDLGVQGDKQAVTPNVDALASHGVRLTNYYANHPVCSPSRAALLTGIYQQRMGFEYNSGTPQNTSPKFGIALDVPTLPERLNKAGYVTAAFGKWHVGFRPETMPTARGFDEYYGFLSGAHAYTRKAADGRRPGGMLRGAEIGRAHV